MTQLLAMLVCAKDALSKLTSQLKSLLFRLRNNKNSLGSECDMYRIEVDSGRQAHIGTAQSLAGSSASGSKAQTVPYHECISHRGSDHVDIHR